MNASHKTTYRTAVGIALLCAMCSLVLTLRGHEAEGQSPATRMEPQQQSAPPQVDVEAHFVEFNADDINDLLVQQGRITETALKELWASGRGDLLSAQKVVTQPGCEATMKVVMEQVYPTEYVPRAAKTVISPDGKTVEIPGYVVPEGFETREVGAILVVLPEVSPDRDLITVTVRPELVREPTWHPYDVVALLPVGRSTKGSMPFFRAITVCTTVKIADGETVLLAGANRVETGRVAYIFVTARLIDAAGEPYSRQ